MPEASWGGDDVWDFINEWTTGTQIDLNVAATPQNLGAAVAAITWSAAGTIVVNQS